MSRSAQLDEAKVQLTGITSGFWLNVLWTSTYLGIRRSALSSRIAHVHWHGLDLNWSALLGHYWQALPNHRIFLWCYESEYTQNRRIPYVQSINELKQPSKAPTGGKSDKEFRKTKRILERLGHGTKIHTDPWDAPVTFFWRHFAPQKLPTVSIGFSWFWSLLRMGWSEMTQTLYLQTENTAFTGRGTVLKDDLSLPL